MMTQERANCAIWNMKQRQPDTTDAEGPAEEEGEQDETLENETNEGELGGEQVLNTLAELDAIAR